MGAVTRGPGLDLGRPCAVASRAMADNNESGLSSQEVEAFARGLWYIATVDGDADEREQTLIREFLAEAKSDLDWATVSSGGFSPLETASFIESSFLRRVFMKAAVAMVWADNVYTDNERQAIGEFADAFGLNNAEFGVIEQEAKRVDLAAAG